MNQFEAMPQTILNGRARKRALAARRTTTWVLEAADWWPFAFFFAYTSVLSIVMLKLFEPMSTFMLVFVELLTIGVAIDLSEYTCVLIVRKPLLPPKLEVLSRRPTVALLMVICDDLVPEAMIHLRNQTYENTDVFILDDSTRDDSRRAVDRVGIDVIRRSSRRGVKAGNLNHWLERFGQSYDYFVVLDSDSILPKNFVEQMLLYAEHPANQQVAIFNSLPQCWNSCRRFPRLLSLTTPLRNWFRLRLENLDITTLSSGHNNLHRTCAVLQTGGFNENLIAEDVALSLALLYRGYQSVLTDIHAFEAEPEHIFSFMRRQRRWALQTIQAVNFFSGPLPLSVRFRLFKLVWGYLAVFLYPVWFIVAAWGATSTWADLKTIAALITSDRVWLGSAIQWILLPLFFPLAMTLAILPFAKAAQIRVRDYLLHLFFAWGLAFYSMIELATACLHALGRNKVGFDVTDKSIRHVTFREVVGYQPLLAVFLAIVATGLSHNVVTLAFALPWFCMLFGCPLVVYWGHSHA